jgi:hypothetical protein
LTLAIVPRGLSSVIPQACVNVTPCRSNPSMRDGGAAAPPTVICRRLERSHFFGWASSTASIPIQMVGTPAVVVTRSFTMRSSRISGSSLGPGKTSFDPTSAAACGVPQAFAWNIGTTGITVSFPQMLCVSVMHMTAA